MIVDDHAGDALLDVKTRTARAARVRALTVANVRFTTSIIDARVHAYRAQCTALPWKS
jgi:hypothetical protein